VYRNFPPLSLILTQYTPSLRNALTPAKNHNPQHQVSHCVAYQPQKRAMTGQRSQRDPLEQGLAQDINSWREWEEPRDRRHPARHAVQSSFS
jgi:hypothetical protein